jgi:hypothetical protein
MASHILVSSCLCQRPPGLIYETWWLLANKGRLWRSGVCRDAQGCAGADPKTMQREEQKSMKELREGAQRS